MYRTMFFTGGIGGVLALAAGGLGALGTVMMWMSEVGSSSWQ